MSVVARVCRLAAMLAVRWAAKKVYQRVGQSGGLMVATKADWTVGQWVARWADHWVVMRGVPRVAKWAVWRAALTVVHWAAWRACRSVEKRACCSAVCWDGQWAELWAFWRVDLRVARMAALSAACWDEQRAALWAVQKVALMADK